MNLEPLARRVLPKSIFPEKRETPVGLRLPPKLSGGLPVVETVSTSVLLSLERKAVIRRSMPSGSVLSK